MDGLALLCNLHADGPLTLRRLRQAGVRSLVELERAPRESLASVLRASNHQAHRFLIEAALLRQRIEQVGGHGQEAAVTPKRVAHPPARKGTSTLASTVETDAAGDAFHAKTPRAPTTERRPFKLPKGARRPQGFDTDGGLTDAVGRRGAKFAPPLVSTKPVQPILPVEPPQLAPAPVQKRVVELPSAPQPKTQVEARPATPPRLPHELAQTQGTLLRHGQIPGLDAATLERLIAQGVRTYRALVDLTSLPLARRSGIPYTRLLDLRYHARRFLAQRLRPERFLSEESPAQTPVASPARKSPKALKSIGEVVLVPKPRDLSSARTDRSYDVPRPDPVSPESFLDEGAPSSSPGIAGPFV